MCLFGGATPAPPVNSPSEKPADSWTKVETSVRPVDGETAPQQASPPANAAPKTSDKAGMKKVRM